MFQVLSGKQSMGRLYFFIHFNLLNAESNLFALIVITDMVGFVTFFIVCFLSIPAFYLFSSSCFWDELVFLLR